MSSSLSCYSQSGQRVNLRPVSPWDRLPRVITVNTNASGWEWSGVVERDPQALERFFEAYFDRVFSVAYRLCGDRHRAEDLTQDTFIRVHRFISSLQSGREPWPWLVTILVNVFNDHYRRSQRSLDEGANLVESARRPDEHAKDPFIRASEGEEAALVQHTLGELPPTFRTSIVLREYQGMTHQEIAEVLGTTAVAARKTHSRAMRLLGDRLREKLK